MYFTKYIARKLIFPIALALKTEKIIRFFYKNTHLNVMYHGVVKNSSTYFSPRHITEDQFEKQLIYFKNNFNIIPLSEAFEKKEKKGNKKKSITISFDDGFKNNLTVALPLLEKHKIPATFFISTTLFTNEIAPYFLWSEAIAAISYFYKNETIKIDQYSFKNLYDCKYELNIIDFIKNSDYKKRDLYLKELIKKYHLVDKINTLPEEVWKLMNKEELLLFSKSPIVNIGSHGHLHYNLGVIDEKKAKEDLKISKNILEENLKLTIDSIAYPDGSYNNKIKDISESLGYKTQLAVNYKENSDKKDARILDRFGISSTTTFESNIFFLNKAFKNKGYKI